MPLNDRFTDLADFVSEKMGTWQVTAFFLMLITIWAGFGPATHYSDAWQLWINTPTTIIELFCECFILSAANRLEKRNRQLHENMLDLLKKIAAEEEQELDILGRGK